MNQSHEVQINSTEKVGSLLKKTIVNLHYKDQPINTVYSMFGHSYKRYTALCGENAVSVMQRQVYHIEHSSYCALTFWRLNVF
jgi:hypothetical protein